MRFAICAGVLTCWAAVAGANETAMSALNQLRGDAGLHPLAYSTELENAAFAHAKDMAQRGFFDHAGSDASDVGDRVSRTAYVWCVVAENIAKGQRDLAEVMDDWAASPGHRRNMLSPDVQDFALVQGAGQIWVMVLGATDC